MPSPFLAKTSHAFLLPAAVGLWTGFPYYSLSCLNLYLSSQAWHYTHHPIAYVWDQTSIQLTWWIGAYHNWQLDAYSGMHYWIITLYLWYIFFYGYLTKSLCFGPQQDLWHSTIHYSSALGILMTLYFSSRSPLSS